MIITNQEKYVILQPVPEAVLDYDFQLDGWRLEDAKTGVLRKKETHHQHTNLAQVVQVREEVCMIVLLAMRHAVIRICRLEVAVRFCRYAVCVVVETSLMASVGASSPGFPGSRAFVRQTR